MSQYVSMCVSERERRPDIVSQGFDYERWKKTYSRMKQVASRRVYINLSLVHISYLLLQPPAVPHHLVMDDPAATLPSKETIVDHLLLQLDEGILSWCEAVDLEQLCSNSHKQLLELKVLDLGSEEAFDVSLH